MAEKAKGSVRILRFRVEVNCEVQMDSDGGTILGVSSHNYSVGARPQDKLDKKDVMDIAANRKALAELACFTVLQKSHEERNALVVEAHKRGEDVTSVIDDKAKVKL